MKCEGCGRKRYAYYPRILMDGLRKTSVKTAGLRDEKKPRTSRSETQ
jgi:hypothetical protein